ncbi:unnamed protein product [Meloidogyne enterolobii]|uniref:Uncharacterized protein n=1 Tax=Meloidogyne enterolobii TaxID=390850 RepID=A0ACB0YNK0_MELEN
MERLLVGKVACSNTVPRRLNLVPNSSYNIKKNFKIFKNIFFNFSLIFLSFFNLPKG